MKKIFVEIICPALSDKFEFRISKNLPVGNGLEKIIYELRCYAQNSELFSGSNVHLISKKTNMVLNENMTFTENGICSGDTLMII